MATKEFYTNSFQRFIDYRNRSLRKSRYLGPLDVCIVLRRSSGSYLSFLSSPAHQTYLHWFLGADTSSVAAICAYFQRLQSLDSGAYAKAGPEIVGATIGVYNAFAGMDLRIQINLDAKPAVSVYAVDESLRRHDRVTEDMLDGAFVCSCLRRIAMPPSLVPSLHVEDDWVPKGVEKLFIKAVERLLEAGAIIKGFENADVIQRQQAVTVLQALIERHFAYTHSPKAGIKFFKPLLTFNPILATSVASLLKLRGRKYAAVRVLMSALRAVPNSVPLLVCQAELLLDLEKPDLALPLALAAVETAPLERRVWVLAARCHCALKDYVSAMIALNGLPEEAEETALTDGDIPELVELPHDAPSENSANMRFLEEQNKKPAHEWEFHDLDQELEEVLNHDILDLHLMEREREPILSNRLSGEFLKAYEVLVSLLENLDFEKLHSLVRDLFYTHDTPHSITKKQATALAAGLSASVAGTLNGSIPRNPTRTQRRLERRAAKLDKKLKKYERTPKLEPQESKEDPPPTLQPPPPSPTPEPEETHVKMTVPMMTVSRVFAQPIGRASSAAAVAAAAEDPGEEEGFREAKSKVSNTTSRKLRRQQRRQKQAERFSSPMPHIRPTRRTADGDVVGRTQCGAQLAGLLGILKEDVRAMVEVRVELKKAVDDHGEEDWQRELSLTKSQQLWLQYGKIARRLHMYEESEILLDMCLSYGYSRAAHAELARLFIDFGLIQPAIDALCDLAAADDPIDGLGESTRRQVLPKLVLKIFRKIVERFGLVNTAEALDRLEEPHEHIQKAFDAVAGCMLSSKAMVEAAAEVKAQQAEAKDHEQKMKGTEEVKAPTGANNGES
ncbi:hypothetical protein AAMO2058_000111300 [Amorphochlora amoebiformis]